MLVTFVFFAAIPASVEVRSAAPGEGLITAASPGRHGALTVSVRRQDGAAVPGAAVRVFLSKDSLYSLSASLTTNARGVAQVEDLPAGAFWVLVEAAGLTRRSTALVLDPGARSLDIVLAPARAVRVSVETEDHQPVANATVLLTGGDPLPFGALTDETGGALIDRLPAPPWKLRVAARGYETDFRSGIVADATVTLRRAGILDVLVTDEGGTPQDSATVLVAGASLWPARQLTSDAAGHARITGIDSGAYDIKAMKGSLVSRTEVGVNVERGRTDTLTLVLAPGRMVPLVVTDGTSDHPVVVPDADVWLVEGGVGSFPIQGRTNRFGTVTLGPVARGNVVAAARADGFIARGAVQVPEEVTEDVRVPLLRGATLRGTVVDPDGRPVDGATIEVVGTDPDGMPIAATPLVAEFQRAHFEWALPGPTPLVPAGELGVTLGAVPPIPAAALGPEILASPLPQLTLDPAEPWVTGFDGSFRATPIPSGRVRALVRHPAYVEGASEVIELGPGGSAEVRVVLRTGGTMEGTVVDEIGRAVAGARVEVVAMEGTGSRAVTTGDDGAFAFATLSSDVMVSVARPEEPFRAVVRKRFELADQRKLEVKLVLPSPRDALEVSAEDDSSRPVKMAQITALSLDPDAPLRATVFTDDAGRATISDAVGLPLRLVVEAPGFARWARQLDKAPPRIAAELASGVLVEGRITAVRGRRDVAGASVELLCEGERRKTVTDAQGRYRFTDVTPGRARLSVSHPDYALGELEVAIEPTGRADRSFDVDPIDLADPAVVEGHVVDAEGKPVAGARVRAGPVGSVVPMGANLPGTALSDADGAFRLSRVPAGKIDIQSVSPRAGRGRTSIDVEAGGSVGDVTVRVRKGPDDDTEPAATGGVAITFADAAASSGGGLVIAQVAPGSEAERAGIVPGDRLDTIDRERASSIDVAERRLAGPDGTDVVVEVSRRGEHVALRVRREPVRR